MSELLRNNRAIASIGIALSLLSTVSSMMPVMAQQPTITPAGEGIGGIFPPERPPEGASELAFSIFNTGSACAQRGFYFFQCVELEYESPTTIVLHGHLLLQGLSAESFVRQEYNSYLWWPVDAAKNLGFVISSVIFSGQGTESDPYIYHVVMSKP